MKQDLDARRMALDREEAAKMTAGARSSALGAAALHAIRRSAERMAKMKAADGMTGPISGRAGSGALTHQGSAPQDASSACARAALSQVRSR